MPFSPTDIADAIADGLQQQARQEDLEQAVYGMDVRSELQLHPLLHDALRRGGFHVLVEQRYPSDRKRKTRSEGKRCDVVLTADPLPLRDPLAEGTLFETAYCVFPVCSPARAARMPIGGCR